MKFPLRRSCALLLLCLALAATAFASAYTAQPKLVVILIIDQFRGDYLDRARDRLAVDGGFRMFLDKGAYFTNCNYEYANTETGPGHATLLTGAYSNGHGILANEWWDPLQKRLVAVAEDDSMKPVGGPGPAYSPRALLTDTLGDELKLATEGKGRVFTVSMKPRAAVMTGGFSADAAYWIDPAGGHWETSSYYMKALPAWVEQFNASGRAEKYWDQDWKDDEGHVLRRTTRVKGAEFYSVVGATPFGNEYELDFAQQLITEEKLGTGPATDLLVVSLSPNDLLGHAVGPDSPQVRAMALALDRELGQFFGFLGRQVGLANVWVALSADHGVSPAPTYAAKFRLPGGTPDTLDLARRVNTALAARLKKPGNYIRAMSMSHVFLNDEAFAAAKVAEPEAERTVGEALKDEGIRGYYMKTQLAQGLAPPDAEGRRFLNSYSPYGGWYVMIQPPPYTMRLWEGAVTTHGSAYLYDRHVPLGFYGLLFQAGAYRGRCEPVDMVATLASLLGINAPNQAVGRVLTEALRRPGAPQ